MNDGTSDDSDSGSANSRSSADDDAWWLVMTELRKRRRDASRVRSQRRAKFGSREEQPADNPAPAREGEDAARVGSEPSARAASRSPYLRISASGDQSSRDPTGEMDDTLPGVV